MSLPTSKTARHRRVGRALELSNSGPASFVELVPLDEVLANGGDYLDAEDCARLHASIDRGLEDFRAGRTTDARQVMAELRARASGR